ncbi:UNVERIFIED_CONTAM: hypothetical protein FKN15_067967 [Acipenser sinensis]
MVPAAWYKDGIAGWPNSTNEERIDRAVKNREDPAQGWYLTKNDDYLKARQTFKDSLTCSTSDLQSEKEDDVTKPKRERTARTRFGDTDSDSDDSASKKGSRKTIKSSLPAAPAVPSPPSTSPATQRPQLSASPSQPPDECVEDFIQSPSMMAQTPRRVTAVPTRLDFPRPSRSEMLTFTPTVRVGRTGTASIPCTGKILALLFKMSASKLSPSRCTQPTNRSSPLVTKPANQSSPLVTKPANQSSPLVSQLANRSSPLITKPANRSSHLAPLVSPNQPFRAPLPVPRLCLLVVRCLISPPCQSSTAFINAEEYCERETRTHLLPL